MIEDTANILDVAMGAFAKYNAHLDYSVGDVVLKLVPTSPEAPGVGSRAGVQQPIQHILDSISTTIDSTKQTQLISFLDLLLVKTNDFLLKYFDWLEKLAGLNARVLELENIRARGMTMRLHEGLIIHSALADTENKIKEQFGGYRWKRIMNFPLLVSNSKRNEVGQRGGESFVSLMRKHIPNHRHGMDIRSDSSGDTWKDNISGTHPFLSGQTPGLAWDTKTVYPEIAALNWNQDNDRADLGSMTGAERYVKPHFNIPPYKDVYIWECTQVNKSVQTMTYTPSVAKIVDAPMGLPGSVSFASVVSPVVDDEDEERETRPEHKFENLPVLPNNIQNNIKSKNPLVCLTALQGWETFMSDALAAESNLRYDSKDAPLPDLADLVDWHIWCETLHIEQRYLFKDAFAYLLEDIQDRIYLLMRRLTNAINMIGKIPQRVFKGQYIFLKGTPSGMSEQQVLAHYYKLPEGLSFVKVSNVFLRGTSMFTEESKSMFNEYATMLDSTEMTNNLGRLTTSGGLSNVNLYSENFPKHLHWSTLLGGLNSASVSDPNTATGGNGSAMMMNDPRSGGLKYGTRNGTGPYKVTIKNYGSTSAISHNNMPKYITMSVYLVS